MKFVTDSVEETYALGERLARALAPGDVLALRGDLGAGKTSFVRGLARGLRVPSEYPVTSPTFVLLQTYPGAVNLHHLDFYRIENASELASLGLTEWLGSDGVVAIEWFEKFPSVWTGDTIEISLTIDSENRRTLEVGETSPRSRAVVAALQGAS